MKKTLLILAATTLTAALPMTSCNFGSENPQTEEKAQTADTVQTRQIHPIIENIFYDLPLEKSRLDLRKVIVNDKRFILTDTTFNNFEPSSFFKGIATNKGLINSNPDSIQVLLFYGNAALVTEKGGKEDFNKHPMGLQCKYFFSNKDSIEKEYEKLLNLVYPIFADTSSIKDDKWEAQFSKGTEKCIGKIFDHFDPYYRVAISTISFKPADGSKFVFILDVVFSKEDK